MHTSKTILIKYGGNAMSDDSLKEAVLHQIVRLHQAGHRVVLVHGGGPFIQKMLTMAGLASEFVGGHRKTSQEALKYVEMALKGEVNGSLISLLNAQGCPAVGLSGKDGKLVVAEKRYHLEKGNNGQTLRHDLGQVGDVATVHPLLLNLLLENGFLPVITCLATSEDGSDYNVNGDMFAGHLAKAIGADLLLLLTDVEGLYEDIDRPESLISRLRPEKIAELFGTVISGGMIPKLKACELAVQGGVGEARIINGTRPELIGKSIQQTGSAGIGTLITSSNS